MFSYAAEDSLAKGQHDAMLRNVRALSVRLHGSGGGAKAILESTERSVATEEGAVLAEEQGVSEDMEASGFAPSAALCRPPLEAQGASTRLIDIEDFAVQDGCGGILACADCAQINSCGRRAAVAYALRTQPKSQASCTLSYVAEANLTSGLEAIALRILRAFQKMRVDGRHDQTHGVHHVDDGMNTEIGENYYYRVDERCQRRCAKGRL